MGTRHQYTRVFKDPEVKAEMLELRLQGYSFTDLARKYGCDHTSVIHQCQLEGLALKREVRNELFALINQGISLEEVANQLQISGTVVEFYCYQYGKTGTKHFRRTDLHLENISPKPPKVSLPRPEITKPVTPVLIKTDSRGVEWSSDGHGGWVCLGRTEKQYKQDEIARKRRELEQKRLAMLTY